jgi:hypothetical protein
MPLTFEQVVECIQKENAYATKGWNKGNRKVSMYEGIGDDAVHSGTSGPAGTPFSLADWWVFTRKYFNEIPDVMANYTPDGGAVRIRIIKVISLLVRALMIYGRPSDLERLAGVSSRNFPVLGGGIAAFDELSSAEGCLISTAETGKLRNEAPSCDPLKN